MCNNELLIGYLYDDLSPADRVAFEAHLSVCLTCRREVEDLGQTRQHLASWAPPEPAVNFRVVRNPTTVTMPARRWKAVPQWALATAASLMVVAGAAALANLEVRYGADGLIVRSGWRSAPAAAPVEPPQAPTAASAIEASEQMTARIAQLTERIAQLEREQSAQTSRVVASVAPGITTPELRKVLLEFEARQRAELAVQIKHLWNDINAMRATDFVRVQQAIAPEFQRQQRSIETQQRSIDNLLYRTAQYK